MKRGEGASRRSGCARWHGKIPSRSAGVEYRDTNGSVAADGALPAMAISPMPCSIHSMLRAGSYQNFATTGSASSPLRAACCSPGCTRIVSPARTVTVLPQSSTTSMPLSTSNPSTWRVWRCGPGPLLPGPSVMMPSLRRPAVRSRASLNSSFSPTTGRSMIGLLTGFISRPPVCAAPRACSCGGPNRARVCGWGAVLHGSSATGDSTRAKRACDRVSRAWPGSAGKLMRDGRTSRRRLELSNGNRGAVSPGAAVRHA